jgi:mono/diheme cytochrome c family protein
MNRGYALLFAFCGAATAHADTPQQQVLAALSATAEEVASPARGDQLFRGKFTGGRSATSCTACHGDDPKATGQHIKTHKSIDPIAPEAQRDRFSDLSKVEKWFKRNCPEVLGRACTAREKADFAAYMISVK